jgi:hypothetical protein
MATVALVVLCTSRAVPAAADVTLRQKTGARSGDSASTADAVSYIKGAKSRTDQAVGGEQVSIVIDADGRTIMVLHHQSREAELFDAAKLGAASLPGASGAIKASLTQTAQTRQIAGTTCTVHTIRVSAPMAVGNEQVQVLLTGPVCLARNGPGQADFTAFYTAVASKGLFVGDPRTAQPATARAMSEVYRQLAERGVPLATELTMSLDGSGAPAGAAVATAKMGVMTMTTEVVSVSTETLPSALFEIPPGYRVTKR